MTSTRRIRIAIAVCVGAIAPMVACNQRDASTAAPPATPGVAPTPVAVAHEHPAAGTPRDVAPTPATPPDAAPAVASTPPPDAAPAPRTARTKADRDAERIALQDEAEKYAVALLSKGSGPAVGLRGGNYHSPGSDLDSQLRDARESGAPVLVGGGARGGNSARGGGTGRGPAIDPAPSGGTGRGPAIDPAPLPSGRITIITQRALATTSLDADAVAHKIQATYMAGLKRCYRQVLARDATARGAMTIHLTVNESGRAGRARVTSFDDDLSSCVETVASPWRFAAPEDDDGEPTTVDFELALMLSPE